MSSLRQELNNQKAKEEKMIDEAAYAWVKNNIILITEKMNRSAVTKFTNSILKFDEKFGPFKDKLPEISRIIEDAEMGLQLVLTGKTSETRATEMLRRLSMVYTILSNFFSSDLPTLLRTPIFKAARENPTTRLDSIVDPSHDIKIIAAAFANALRPSKDELKLISKVYKSIPMLVLKADVIAKQLLSMSFDDLQQMSTVERIPMIAVDQRNSNNDLSDFENLKRLQEDLEEQVTNNANIAELGKALSSLTAIVSTIPELKNSPIFAAVTNLKKEAQKAIADGRLGALMRQGPSALFRDPVGKVLAQAQMAIEMFRKLGAAWPKIQPLFADGEFDAEEQKELIKILRKELDGGLLTQLKNAFKVPPYQGLTSADLIKVISDIAAASPASSKVSAKPTGSTGATQQVQEKRTLREDFSALENFFSKLNTSFKPTRASYFDSLMNAGSLQGNQEQNAVATPTQTTGQTTPTTSAAKVDNTKTTEPTRGTGPVSTNQNVPKQNEPLDIVDASRIQLQQIEKATGVPVAQLTQLGRNKFVTVTVDPRIFKNVR